MANSVDSLKAANWRDFRKKSLLILNNGNTNKYHARKSRGVPTQLACAVMLAFNYPYNLNTIKSWLCLCSQNQAIFSALFVFAQRITETFELRPSCFLSEKKTSSFPRSRSRTWKRKRDTVFIGEDLAGYSSYTKGSLFERRDITAYAVHRKWRNRRIRRHAEEKKKKQGSGD